MGVPDLIRVETLGPDGTPILTAGTAATSLALPAAAAGLGLNSAGFAGPAAGTTTTQAAVAALDAAAALAGGAKVETVLADQANLALGDQTIAVPPGSANAGTTPSAVVGINDASGTSRRLLYAFNKGGGTSTGAVVTPVGGTIIDPGASIAFVPGGMTLKNASPFAVTTGSKIGLTFIFA